MGKYNKIKNQDLENTDDDDDLFGNMSEEDRNRFWRGVFADSDSELQQIEEEAKNMELLPYTRRHKLRMNRLFRERVGGSFLPFPEADNLFERVRSKIVIKLRINEFIARCKDRRRYKRR